MSRYLLLFLVVFTTGLSAQDISEEQKNALIPGVKKVLEEYGVYSQFSIDGIGLDNGYMTSFSALFDPKMKHTIFNDINPSKKGTFPNVAAYVQYVRTNYRQGLDITISPDSLAILDGVLKKGVYTFRVKVNKKIRGVFNSQAIHRFDDDLYFGFSATPDDQGNMSNLKINGVLTTDGNTRFLVNKEWKGISVGLTGIYSQSQIYRPSLNSGDLWQPSLGSSIYPGLDLAIMVSNGFGIGTGLRLSTYSSSFALDSYNDKSEVRMTDKDGDTYYPVLDIDKLTEQVNIKTLDIPLILKFRAGKGKTKFYFDVGAIYSMISGSYFTLDGKSVKSGEYNTLNVTLYDIPEYDFGTFNYDAGKQYELTMETSGISAYSSLGLLFQLAPGLLLKVGAGVTYGITDLKFDQENPNNYLNFVSTEPLEETTFRSAGAELGLSYRIHFKHK